jgi:hypothetical protein
MRIFIYYPTRQTPGGGHKQFRILARDCGRLGYSCYLLKENPSFDDSRFYGIEPESASFAFADAGPNLKATDVVVLPEYRLDEVLPRTKSWPCRKAVYAQGGFLALLHRPVGGYERNGVMLMLGVSPYIVALAPRFLGMPAQRAFLVPCSVYRGPFAEPAPPFAAKTLAVCYMPRKLPEHVRRVREVVSMRHPAVPWVEIDGLEETEVAKRLSENAIFLSTQNNEGCPLPALEAMSRGCIVAGYRGTGLFSHPYANATNGLWARDRSPAGASRQVERAIVLARQGGTRLAQLLESASDTARRYSENRALQALKQALAGTLGDAPLNRRDSGYRLGFLGTLQALRTLYVARHMRAAARRAMTQA